MKAPFLLTMADYYGTLAAVRCLGRAGIPVTVAEGRWLAPARWSRFVTQRVACPSVSDTEAFLEWLLRFGEQQPGHVLYPTSDELAWLFALHREALSRNFQLYQPPFESLYGLLNKRHLLEACQAVGIEAPRTYFPTSDAELVQVAREAGFPVLIKPQTQILFESHVKGAQVESASALVSRYREFVRKNRYGAELLARDPGVVHPMVQAFHPEAAQDIYSLSGFVDESGTLSGLRAAIKVLQRPRKLGIGLCFEHAEVEPALAEKLVALCQHVWYHGIFEVEFIRVGEAFLLIDFNPRFYSQMGFEIARGLPLPVLVWLAATGNREALGQALEISASWAPGGRPVYSHRFILEVLLRAQGLSGKLSATEVSYWRSWYARAEGQRTDAVLDAADLVPSLVDAVVQLKGYARHPRSFLRSMVLDR